MDAQRALYDLLDAMTRNDRKTVDELLEALKEWNQKGGFMPQVLEPRANGTRLFMVCPKVQNLEETDDD